MFRGPGVSRGVRGVRRLQGGVQGRAGGGRGGGFGGIQGEKTVKKGSETPFSVPECATPGSADNPINKLLSSPLNLQVKAEIA